MINIDELISSDHLDKIRSKQIKRFRDNKLEKLREAHPTYMKISDKTNKLILDIVDVLKITDGYTTQEFKAHIVKHMDDDEIYKYVDNNNSLTYRLDYLVQCMVNPNLNITSYNTLLNALNLDIIIVEK